METVKNILVYIQKNINPQLKEKTKLDFKKLLYKGSECSYEKNNKTPVCKNWGSLKVKIRN